jgi:uncharacterized protein
MNFSQSIRQYPVTIFIILTLGLSFLTFLLPVPQESAFMMIAMVLVMIPTIVAFFLVGLMDGRQGLRAFLREIFNRRAAPKWFVIALALGFVIHFSASVLSLITGISPAIEFGEFNAMVLMVFPLALLEEIGWRGFALRRLLKRYSPITATLILGIPWALLHFSLFFYFVPEVSPIAEMLLVVAFALSLTWIYIRAGYSVLAATVLHGSINAFAIASAAIPPAEVLWYVLASASIVAGLPILFDWRLWLARPEENTASQGIPAAA